MHRRHSSPVGEGPILVELTGYSVIAYSVIAMGET